MNRGNLLLGLLLTAICAPVLAADEAAEFRQWALEYETIVERGEALFSDPFFSENGQSCADCHAGASKTHPETYPKYRKSQQRVIQFWEMVNWCVNKALGKPALAPDSAEMTALVTYITHASKGATLRPGGP